MHRQLRGACEIVGDTPADTGADDETEDAESGGLVRKPTGLSSDKRHRPTPTLKQIIARRKMDLGLSDAEIRVPPSGDEIRRFEDYVDRLDNDPSQFMAYKQSLPQSEQLALERSALRIFCYFEAKENDRVKLSTAEFKLKSMVDDLLVRLLICSPLDASAPQTAPGLGPVGVDSLECVWQERNTKDKEGAEGAPVSAGMLITEPAVATHVTPLPARVVLSGASEITS